MKTITIQLIRYLIEWRWNVWTLSVPIRSLRYNWIGWSSIFELFSSCTHHSSAGYVVSDGGCYESTPVNSKQQPSTSRRCFPTTITQCSAARMLKEECHFLRGCWLYHSKWLLVFDTFAVHKLHMQDRRCDVDIQIIVDVGMRTICHGPCLNNECLNWASS